MDDAVSQFMQPERRVKVEEDESVVEAKPPRENIDFNGLEMEMQRLTKLSAQLGEARKRESESTLENDRLIIEVARLRLREEAANRAIEELTRDNCNLKEELEVAAARVAEIPVFNEASRVISNLEKELEEERNNVLELGIKERELREELKLSEEMNDELGFENGALRRDIFDLKRELVESNSRDSPSSPSRSLTAGSAEEDLIEMRPVKSVQDLKLARLSRFRLAKFVHAPFFKDLAIGCFAKIGDGKLQENPTRVNYTIAQVVDVVETDRVYDVEKRRTNKGLKLRFGSGDERVYRLEFISNKEFKDNDFQEWMVAMKTHNQPLPIMGDIHKKMKDIANATSHAYTNREVEQILSEMRRFKVAPNNVNETTGDASKEQEDESPPSKKSKIVEKE